MTSVRKHFSPHRGKYDITKKNLERNISFTIKVFFIYLASGNFAYGFSQTSPRYSFSAEG